ncbi:MAG: aminotransferase class I/II-fold pyridoxal phosphate-dependent enzyme [Bacillota bacterium]
MNRGRHWPEGFSSCVEHIMQEIKPAYERIERTRLRNQLAMLSAFRSAGVRESDFSCSTGYGYGDRGRETLEKVYANYFGTESALVRIQMVSGTQAISQALIALCSPGKELLSVTGQPYDTLLPTVEYLKRWGVRYRCYDVWESGLDELPVFRDTAVVFIQRSGGYRPGRSLGVEKIGEICKRAKELNQKVVCLVDNCYGEFVQEVEPTHVGADVVAGSLIKNPGGGLAPSGGYIAGREDLVRKVAEVATAPGLSGEVGPSLGFNRLLYQGFFLAPHVVAESLMGMVFFARFMAELGWETRPAWNEPRSDIIQSVVFRDRELLITACKCIQRASPVDSAVTPEPWDMPGYEDPVIMAAGTFVQGASIELSADAPIRPPYAMYVQGGLVREQVLEACAEIYRALGKQPSSWKTQKELLQIEQ